jgi:hypothetical protein
MESIARLVVVVLLTVALIGPATVAISLLDSIPIFFVWVAALLSLLSSVGIFATKIPIMWLGLLPAICAVVSLYIRYK